MNGFTFHYQLISQDLRKGNQSAVEKNLTFQYRLIEFLRFKRGSCFLLYHRTDWLFIVSLLHRISENSQFPFISPNGLTFYCKLTSQDIRNHNQSAISNNNNNNNKKNIPIHSFCKWRNESVSLYSFYLQLPLNDPGKQSRSCGRTTECVAKCRLFWRSSTTVVPYWETQRPKLLMESSFVCWNGQGNGHSIQTCWSLWIRMVR